MIRINHTDTMQAFALTCTELSTLTNPNYLFVFTHEMTGEIQRAVLPDTSTNKRRFNLFKIPGTFFIRPDWYTYKVYEQSSPTNENEALSGVMVEQGRLYVVTDNEHPFIENTTSQNNFTEYGG